MTTGFPLAPRAVSAAADPERALPTSSVQARLWARHHVEPAGGLNLAAAVRVRGPLDLGRLARALELASGRHELLRTRFALVEDRPRQLVGTAAAHELLFIDAREVPDERAANRLRTAVRHPFDLETGPLWRAILVREGEEAWKLVVCVHGLLADRRSLHLLLGELLRLYDEAVAGPPIRHAVVATEESALAYWQEQLAGWTPVGIAGDPTGSRLRAGRHPTALPAPLVAALRGLGREHGIPLEALLLTVFQILLARYTGERDIAVATASRRHDAEPRALGPLTCLLPIRADLDDGRSGLECAHRIRDALSAARRHHAPYEDVAEALELPPVPRAAFAFEERAGLGAPPGLEVELAEVEAGTAPAELSLHLFQDGARISGCFEYDCDVLEAETVGRVADHFLRLARGLAEEPARPIARAPMVAARERERLLACARGPRVEGATETPVHRRFEAQVDRAPDATALVADGGSWSYRTLDEKANQLARHLVALGVGPESLVCVHLERSPELIVALLAVLKAGAAYVPMDAAYPRERLAYVLERTGARLLLTQAALLPAGTGRDLRAVCLDTDWAAIAQRSTARLDVAVRPEQLAYVIFTSGSTGTPKGVMIEHRSLSHYTTVAADTYEIGPGETVLQFASISFDASVEEIYPTLTRGATLNLRRSANLESPARFLARCGDERITVLSLPTAYWHELVAALPRGDATLPGSLRLMIIGGEAASAPAVAAWRLAAPGVRLLNTYGPTEATVVTTVWDAAGATPDLAMVPIGRPLPGTAAYVLDASLDPVPVGVPGELWIGGAGVGRGYLGAPELTAERFVPDPFAGDRDARLYRTGDRCRVKEGGELEFLGRADHQLKLHGHRIELGEIESHLRSHPRVADAAVVATTDERGEVRVVGHVVPREPGGLRAQELRSHLERWLVPHLIPALAIRDSLPRTVGGKVDRRALGAPLEVAAPVPVEGARGPMEELVLQLFREALGGRPVGIHDDFFAVGGDSLSAMDLAVLVENRLHLELPVRVLYEHSTVASLAQALMSDVHGDSVPVSIADLAAEAPLDPAIRAPAVSAAPAVPPATVLLSGATGFFGAFLLAELLAATTAKVVCLVRARSVDEANLRLRAAWTRYFAGVELPAERVVALPGDLAQLRFGMSEARFRQLADEVDAIYHSGAAVNYLLPYRSLRPANVQGTEEMLRLAATGRVKPMHHVSSMATLGELDDGYAQTKWVAEKLCAEARDRGLPVTIYRPGRLTGHTRTGASNAGDLLVSLLASCVELAAAPELELDVDMVPVDFASAALVRLSMCDVAGQTFDLGHAQPIRWDRLVAALIAFGYPLRRLPYDSWSAAVKQAARHRQGHRARLVGELSRDELTRALAADYDCTATLAAIADAGGAPAPAIEDELLRAGFAFLVQAGLLHAPPETA